MTMKCKIYKGGYIPERAHFSDAGSDLRTPIAFDLEPMGAPEHKDSFVVDLLVAVQIPIGFYGKLESKSGLNVKSSVVCPGGVIDAGYRGTIVCRLQNQGNESYHFDVGDKICQMIVQPCSLDTWDDVGNGELDDPADGRGASGFGSTGK